MFQSLALTDGTNLLGSLPVIGIFIVLILREIGSFVKSDRSSFFSGMSPNKQILDKLSSIETKISAIETLTSELHKWHDKEDADGVKVWYVRQSLETAILKLTDTIASQTDLIKTYPAIMESIVDKLGDLSREVRDHEDTH